MEVIYQENNANFYLCKTIYIRVNSDVEDSIQPAKHLSNANVLHLQNIKVS